MQTKNINIEQAPLNNVPQKLLLMSQPNNQNNVVELNSPPLPPRTAIIFTPLPGQPLNLQQIEVEGYGPYKPVPPPKPVAGNNANNANGGILTPSSVGNQHSAALSGQYVSSGSFTPPPYRMPPYPLYGEQPAIPGSAATPTQLATGLDGQAPTAASTPHGLHTHSSKFPIEREVILSSGDKNCKIPILNEYKKRAKVAIAPDVPPKQMAAWTQQHQLQEIQNHTPSHITTNQQNAIEHTNGLYRATSYHNSHDYVYGQNAGSSTGAVPRNQQWHGAQTRSEEINKQQGQSQRQYQDDNSSSNNQVVSVTIENQKEQKDGKNSKSMTKTYHTIKDMISSRFKGKDEMNGDKIEEAGLNNVAEELRKSIRSIDKLTEETEDPRTMKKPAGEQGIYGKPRTDQGRQEGITLQQYNQHLIQQQLMHSQQIQLQNQQIQQQFQTQQFKSQFAGQIQIAQSRSQEMLATRPHPGNQESLYYHGSSYGVTPQRSANRYNMQANSEQTYVMMHHPQFGELKVNTRETYNERLVDDRRVVEPRSPQQIERDNIRRKSFEARRAASQPQLAYDEDDKPTANGENGNQSNNLVTPVRRGSHGNLIESISRTNQESEKDSDDGGFIQRQPYQERKADKTSDNTTSNEDKSSENTYSKEESKVVESLTGAPRKKLEGEIGKIEGVYNVGQRIRTLNGEQIDLADKRGSHRKTNGSAASSDYDKTGGPSSNADSGRGSAAYSSGRRMGNDTSTESSDTHQLPSANYGSTIQPSHDSEWVDIVENELRNILEPKLHELSLNGNNPGVANSTVSESISSMTPPLPPLSPGDGSSPNVTPRNSNRYKHTSLPYGSKPEYGIDSYNKPMKGHSGIMGPGVGNRWHPSSSQKHRLAKKMEHASMLKGKPIFGDITDLASTTTRSLDLDSMMDGHSDSDGDISTTDARAIRKQLEGLESMYSEVLKLLGVKKHSGRYQPSDPRFSKRRYGSMSSLPSSSVSSRPIRDKRRAHDDRKKVKDLRGINKRFQRLESHVVTLARSVAHLSSEMRTQHLMIQEMENIRGEISALRTQTNMLNVRSQSAARGPNNSSKDLPSLSNPTRVKKLTKFFGDEPPLLRLFLKKLGYEKYANVFENERVGMVELPYLSEERLQKMGVPLGPRLRIMQEAQISVCKDNTLCIV